MKSALSIMLLLAIVAGAGFAEDSKEKKERKPDYQKERFAFADEKDFKPYALQAIEKALIKQAMESWQAREQAEAFKTFDEILAIYPYSIETHRRLADGCEVILESIEDAEQKKFFEELEAKHRGACEGIIDSIVAKRDGKTEKSAYEVITISEEYWVMMALGLTPTNRDSDTDKGFDIFTVKDSEGEERKVYFDISRLLKAKGNQDGADKTATDPEPKSESKKEHKPKPGSEEHSE